MQHAFTAAAQRALATASAASPGPESRSPALLLGLLAEAECRAALILAQCGVSAAIVKERWPELTEGQNPGTGPIFGVPALNSREIEGRKLGPVPFAPSSGNSPRQAKPPDADLELALQAARQPCDRGPHPLPLATEHLLFGLVANENEVGRWLAERGLNRAVLEREIPALAAERSRGDSLDLPPSAGTGPFFGVAAPVSQEIVGRKHGPVPFASPAADTREGPGCEIAVLRVLDAAANRAREALRVVEDYVRFVLDDRHLTELCKQLRHDLAAALRRVPIAYRLAARETQGDVGTGLATPTERVRADLAAVLTANFMRLEEAFRSLEEFAKLGDAELAAALKQLRYRAYTLHRAIDGTARNVERLAAVRLYVLLDGRATPEEFATLVRSLVAAGVGAIQLRDKKLDDRPLLARARLLREATRGSGTLAIVNDRPDLAALAQADGVHVGQEELSVKDARTIVGPQALVGVSTHSLEQARQAVLDGADYLGVGPTFPSGTKQFADFPGLPLLRAVAAEIRLPAFAIGGITAANMSQVLETDVGRIAVSAAVSDAPDPAAAARALLDTLQRSSPLPLGEGRVRGEL